MKTKNLFLSLLMSVVFVLGMTNTYASTDKKEKKTVVLKAELHCKSCVAKIEKNIPFEKGVKDLKVDMKANTVTVTYRADKNNKENLIKAIEKLGIKVYKDNACTGKCGPKCCKVTGDKSKCCKKGHNHKHDAKCDSKCSNEHKCTGKCGTKCCKVTGDKSKCCKKGHKHAKCDSKCSKDHKCDGDCKNCEHRDSKSSKCTGNCKTCKDKNCEKAGTDAKCDKKHNCKGCTGCSK